jgi:hypothetical protein
MAALLWSVFYAWYSVQHTHTNNLHTTLTARVAVHRLPNYEAWRPSKRPTRLATQVHLWRVAAERTKMNRSLGDEAKPWRANEQRHTKHLLGRLNATPGTYLAFLFCLCFVGAGRWLCMIRLIRVIRRNWMLLAGCWPAAVGEQYGCMKVFHSARLSFVSMCYSTCSCAGLFEPKSERFGFRCGVPAESGG